MFDIEGYVKNWFSQNAMNPLFSLPEFCKKHKVEAIVKNNEVRFIDECQHTDIAKLLDNIVFEIGTWKILRNENVRSTESSTEQSKSARTPKNNLN